MIQKLLRFRDNIILFSIGCSGIGFIYMMVYYHSFDLPVIYYLSLNDLLLFALTILLPVAIVGILFEFLVINLLKKLINIVLRKLNRQEIAESNYNFTIAMILNLLLIILALSKAATGDPKLYFFVILITTSISGRLMKNSEPSKIYFPVVMFFFGLFLGIHSQVLYAKSGYSNQDVKFEYNDKIVSTGLYSDLSYIGETSGFVFLYDVVLQTTLVFDKEKLSRIAYSNKIINEKWYFEDLKITNRKIEFVKTKKALTAYKNAWKTSNNTTFKYTVEQTPQGISRLISNLKYILSINKIDYDVPAGETTFLPKDMKIENDLKELNDAILSGNYEVAKWWGHSSGMISLELNKKEYILQFIRDNKKSYNKK